MTRSEDQPMPSGQWKLLLHRPHRRQLWRAAFGASLLVALLDGGFHTRPPWIAEAVDVAVFALAVWLLFSAGLAFGASTTEQEAAEQEAAEEEAAEQPSR